MQKQKLFRSKKNFGFEIHFADRVRRSLGDGACALPRCYRHRYVPSMSKRKREGICPNVSLLAIPHGQESIVKEGRACMHGPCIFCGQRSPLPKWLDDLRDKHNVAFYHCESSPPELVSMALQYLILKLHKCCMPLQFNEKIWTSETDSERVREICFLLKPQGDIRVLFDSKPTYQSILWDDFVLLNPHLGRLEKWILPPMYKLTKLKGIARPLCNHFDYQHRYSRLIAYLLTVFVVEGLVFLLVSFLTKNDFV